LPLLGDVAPVNEPLHYKRARLQEWDTDGNFELGSAKACRMGNNGDQCAIRISEGYRDHKGRTDLFRHPQIKKPDITPDRRHSMLANK
jgi:hypothetical protein